MIGWSRSRNAVVAAAILMLTTAAGAGSSLAREPVALERQVLTALNMMRVAPQSRVADLEVYRQHLRGRIVTMPGTRISYGTSEGAVPVREATLLLARMESREPLIEDPVLAAAAADHVAAQSVSGMTGHYGADGAGPAARVGRRGGGRMVTEVIAYGALDAADVVRQLVIDDGVPDRGHRKAIFAGHLRYAGVACGPHPKFRTMCVIDMADTPGGETKRPERLRIASAG